MMKAKTIINFSKLETLQPLIKAIKVEFPKCPIFSIPYIGSTNGFSEVIRISNVKKSANVYVYPQTDYALDHILQALHRSWDKNKIIILNSTL